ncbi:hypothetical protein NKH18_48210 [Streptomyces sp. M10(2022)]
MGNGDRRPATGDRRPATGDRRPATGFGPASGRWPGRAATRTPGTLWSISACWPSS